MKSSLVMCGLFHKPFLIIRIPKQSGFHGFRIRPFVFFFVAHCSLFQAEADFEDASSRLKVWKKCGWGVRQTHLRVDFLHASAIKNL